MDSSRFPAEKSILQSNDLLEEHNDFACGWRTILVIVIEDNECEENIRGWRLHWLLTLGHCSCVTRRWKGCSLFLETTILFLYTHAMDSSRFPAEKSILQSNDLLEYILKTSAYPREHEQLKQLREETMKRYQLKSIMNLPVDEAQLLSLLLKIMNAKKTLEVGVFTGYSLLATALALPEDGKIIAIDHDEEAYNFGLRFIKNAGVENKIEFIQSDGMSALNNLLNNGEEEGTFDFIFVDADKRNYMSYHELVLKLVKVGGIIAYDNTLWFGVVALPDDDPMSKNLSKGRTAIMKFNSFIANDSRIESILLSVGDGVTICRRLS